MNRSRKRKPLGKHDRYGIYLIVVVVAIVAVLGGLAAYWANLSQIDPDTLCPKNVPLLSHQVVLIDKTDPLTESQMNFLGRRILELKEGLEPGEKLSMFVLDADNLIGPKPLFSKCSPGRGDQANALYQNPKQVKAKFDRYFEAPLQEELQALRINSTSNTSPIFEMIREIGFLKDFSPTIRRRRMLLASDLLQHMPPKFSLYAEVGSYERFSQTAYGQENQTDLNQVEMEIDFFQRPSAESLQGSRQFIEFWLSYLGAQGVRVSLVRKVP